MGAQDNNFTIGLSGLHPSVAKVTLPTKPVLETQCAKDPGYEAEAAGKQVLQLKDPRTWPSSSESWPNMAPILQGFFYLHFSLPAFMDFLLFGKTVIVEIKRSDLFRPIHLGSATYLFTLTLHVRIWQIRVHLGRVFPFPCGQPS